MGIPGFFGWLKRNFRWVVNPVRDPRRVDALYLDMNALIHPCCATAPTETEGFAVLAKTLDQLIVKVAPTRLLYLAVDGVAPRAKMMHQRGRRFLSAQERKDTDWDRNQITPGTPYMTRLTTFLKSWCQQIQCCTVVLSDAAIPGEGEHKILAYLRKYGYNFQKQAVYSPDADMILLGLASRVPQLTVLRHDHFKPELLHAVDLDRLRKLILARYPPSIPPQHILDDWIVLTFLGGNDFLPPLKDVIIGKDGLDPWFTRHIEFVTSGRTLVCDRVLHTPNLQEFLREHCPVGSWPPLKSDLEHQDSDFLCAYIRGWEFVTLYYLQGCPSWTWCYTYHTAPTLSQLLHSNTLPCTEFETTSPCTPLEQLVSVLPPSSAGTCLPIEMASVFDPLQDYCPTTFPVLHEDGRPEWQVTPVLPQLPAQVVQEQVQKFLPALTASATKRNRLEQHAYRWKPQKKRKS